MEQWRDRRLGFGDACHAFPGPPLRLRVRFGVPAAALRMLRFSFVSSAPDKSRRRAALRRAVG